MPPDRTAFVFEGQRTSYGEFPLRTVKLAAQLRAAGIRPGDRGAYLGPNHPVFAEALFATHALGGIFVPLNFRLAAPAVDHMLGDSEAVALVHAPECAGVVASLRHRDALRLVVALREPAAGEVEHEPWLRAGEEEPEDVNVTLDDPALILYASGTTEGPKGCVLTHGNLLWNCFNIMIGVDIAADEVTLISAPLFHVAILDQTLLQTFLKGGCSVIMPSWDVDDCYERIERHGIILMFGMTSMFSDLARSPRWASADLSSLRNLMSGGVPLPEALIRTHQERGLVFCQGCVLTETAPGATFLEAGESSGKAGSAGVPVFFADVRVVRPDGTGVQPGERGEVLIRGANVEPGCWRIEAATEAAFSDGDWFRSGDVATVDEEGHMSIVDRLKGMCISGGENVYPVQVEAVLFEHPAAAERAVVGMPDARWGEVGKAFVVDAGGPVPAEELRGFLASRLAKYKVPVHVEFVESLPRTGAGKVRKSELGKTGTSPPVLP